MKAAADPRWRVTVATLDRVLLEEAGRTLLAVERTATYDPARNTSLVRGKPYGGAVRILDEGALRREIGDFDYDSQRSRSEGDFRILVPPSAWERVKQFCLRQLAATGEAAIELGPQRELAEEFMDALHVRLEAGQVDYRDAGIVIENKPVITGNVYSPGVPTVRLYHIFEARILDEGLCAALLENSRRYSDADLQAMADADAAQGGRGRANAALALPLEAVGEAYQQTPPAERGRLLNVDGHVFHSSVLAVLDQVEAPEYERINL